MKSLDGNALRPVINDTVLPRDVMPLFIQCHDFILLSEVTFSLSPMESRNLEGTASIFRDLEGHHRHVYLETSTRKTFDRLF